MASRSSINVREMLLRIKQWPCLYDPRDNGYRQTEVKTKAWEDVALAAMFDFTTDLSQSDKDLRVCLLKKKWRHVSDYYKSEKKEEVIRNAKYIYSDELSFLDEILQFTRLKRPVAHRRASTTSYETEDNFETYKAESDEDSYDTYKPELSSAFSSCTQTPEPKQKKFKSDSLSSLDIVEEDTSANNSDKYFFMAILSQMKNMSENDKIDLKIQILQCLKNIVNKKK